MFHMEEDDFRIGDSRVSCPLLVVQVKNIPDEGIELTGQLPLRDLDLQDDERFIFGESVTDIAIVEITDAPMIRNPHVRRFSSITQSLPLSERSAKRKA